MNVRRGFTLMEVMVAIVLAGSIALLAYGSAQSGFDTADRLDRYHRGAESEALMRVLITDGLRHLTDAPSGGPATFHVSAPGASSDSLSFVTRGLSSPNGAGPLWLVTLFSAGGSVKFRAYPLEDAMAAPIEAVVESVNSFTVRSLPEGAQTEWMREWSSPRQTPAAVEISFSSDASSNPPAVLVMVSGTMRR